MHRLFRVLFGFLARTKSGKKTKKAAAAAVKGRVILKKGRMAIKEQKIGKVVHLYHKINVAILELVKPLKVGDKIHFVGSTTDVTQAVASLQINHESVSKAGKGEQVGILLDKKAVVKEGDIVYLSQ